MAMRQRRWRWSGLIVLAALTACSSEERDAQALRDALANLPRDTSTQVSMEPEPVRTSEPESIMPESTVAETLPDTVAFGSSPAVAPIERDTTPIRLTPGRPTDIEPWIPESAPLPLSPEWTTGVREDGDTDVRMATLRSVRTGRNDGFDRIVFEFEAAEVPGYRVEYVEAPVRQCGSGQPTTLRGTAWLRVRLEPARAHDDRGRPTVQDREREANLPSIQELRLICDYEGQVEWVLSLGATRPFRVTKLTAPARLIVDVRED